jgi:hypothetical protein
MKTKWVIVHLNPSQFFSINTYDQHAKQNNLMNASSFFASSACCAAKSTSPRSLECTCDRESTSMEPSSSAILHREKLNKDFEKCSTWLLNHFIKLSSWLIYLLTGHTPTIIVCNMQRAVAETQRFLINPIVIKEEDVTYVLFSQIMSDILIMIIFIGMILLDNILQCVRISLL